mgnify:CR=1 FL=1
MKPPVLAALLFAAITCLTATIVAQSPDLQAEGKAWWAHVQFLADDKLEGRNVGTPGYEKALDYVEGQFKAIGLKPAGTSGFRQPVKYDNRTLAADQSQLVLVRDAKEQIEQTRVEIDQAKSRYDYQKAAELQYGKLAELEKNGTRVKPASGVSDALTVMGQPGRSGSCLKQWL